MYKKILAPLDGSKPAECVLPHVESILKGCGAESVVFLRAIVDRITARKDFSFSMEQWQAIEAREMADSRAYLDRTVRRLSRDGTGRLTEVLPGDPAQTISDYAQENGVDLIVIATHGPLRDQPLGLRKRGGQGHAQRHHAGVAGATRGLRPRSVMTKFEDQMTND